MKSAHGTIPPRRKPAREHFRVARLRPTAPRPIFAAGSARRLNGVASSRRPIPDNWHSHPRRSSPYHLAGNRNAAHPVNAILNYAYAALESEIRIKAISDGYDPTIGIMHEGSDGSSKFIFDLMEPERPRISIVRCWISSRSTSSIRPILSFAAMASAGLIRRNGADGGGEGFDIESLKH